MATVEEWKTHPEYSNYQFSSLGRCRNVKTGRLRKITSRGIRRRVEITDDSGRLLSKRISVFVLETFERFALPGEEPTHLNRDLTDSRLVNLTWGRGNHKASGGVRMPRTQCSIEGCDRVPRPSGACSLHLKRIATTGTPGPAGLLNHSLKGDCEIPGCEGVPIAKQACQVHYHLKVTYSLEVQEIVSLELKKECGNKFCRSTQLLRVDHDHSCCPGTKSCGKCVRGWLCHPCNTSLGFQKDNPERLQGLIDYLTERRVHDV